MFTSRFCDHLFKNSQVELLPLFQEFQKSLGAKQPVYDNVCRTGRSLKDRCPEPDTPVIEKMVTDLKHKWNNVCGKSVDRYERLYTTFVVICVKH